MAVLFEVSLKFTLKKLLNKNGFFVTMNAYGKHKELMHDLSDDCVVMWQGD